MSDASSSSPPSLAGIQSVDVLARGSDDALEADTAVGEAKGGTAVGNGLFGFRDDRWERDDVLSRAAGWLAENPVATLAECEAVADSPQVAAVVAAFATSQGGQPSQ